MLEILRTGFVKSNAQERPNKSSQHYGIKFVVSPLFRDLLVARELELGYMQGLNHMFFILQLGVDIHDDLGRVNPTHCAPEFPKGSPPYLSGG